MNLIGNKKMYEGYYLHAFFITIMDTYEHIC